MNNKGNEFLKKYETISEAVSSGAFYVAGVKPDDTVYHYTGLSAMKSIMDKREFWATDFRFMNDEEEFRYVEYVTQKALKMRFDYTDPGYVTFCTRLMDKLSDIFKEKPLNESEVVIDRDCNDYVLCFSQTEDNLTLWSEFANQGCALEICLFDILDSIENFNMRFSHGRVIYDEYTQRHMISDDIIEVLNLFFPDCNVIAGSELWARMEKLSGQDWNYLAAACVKLIRYRGMFMKRTAFRAENEYRVIIHCDQKDKRKFLTAHGMMKPYIELPLLWENHPVRGVQMSPGNSSDISVLSMREYLTSTGDAEYIKVSKSGIKLRY